MFVSQTPQLIDPTELNATIEWGCPFRTLAGGYIVDASGYFGCGGPLAPETVYVGDDDPYWLDNLPSEWGALQGYTGQYGYSGPIMHPSESLWGRIAEDIVAHPGVYVLVTVETYDEDDDEPAGWAVLKLNDDPMSNN